MVDQSIIVLTDYALLVIIRQLSSEYLYGGKTMAYPKIDENQVRAFYNFLPWANKNLTMLQFQLPNKCNCISEARVMHLYEKAEELSKATITRDIARNENEFVKLVLEKSLDTSQHYNICAVTNPLYGDYSDYLDTETRTKAEILADMDQNNLVEYRMLCFSINCATLKKSIALTVELIKKLKPNDYRIVSSGDDIHVWIPIPKQDQIPWPMELHSYICKELSLLSKGEKLRISSEPFSLFSMLPIPGTWNISDSGKSNFVEFIDTAPRKWKFGKLKGEETKNSNIAKILKEIDDPKKATAKEKKVRLCYSYSTINENIERLNFENATKWCKDEFKEIVESQDKHIHVFPLPAGFGKTTIATNAIAELVKEEKIKKTEKTKILYFLPRHELIDEVIQMLKKNHKEISSYIDKMPAFEERKCDFYKYSDAKKAKAKGFLIEVCEVCPKRKKKCVYRKEKKNVEDALILFAPTDYIKIDGFWKSHGAERPVVFIDESPLDKLQAEVNVEKVDMRKLYNAIEEICKANVAKPEGEQIVLSFIEEIMGYKDNKTFRMKSLGTAFKTALPKWNDDFQKMITKKFPKTISKKDRRELMGILRDLINGFQNSDGKAFLHTIKKRKATNKREATKKTLDVEIKYRWYIPHYLPVDRTHFILDATANETLLKGHFLQQPERRSKDKPEDRSKLRFTYHNPYGYIPLEGSVVQVVSDLFGRRQVERLTNSDSMINKITAQINIITNFFPKDTKFGLISHKGGDDLPKRIHEKLSVQINDDNMSYFYNLRGTNKLEKCNVLVVVGTPRLPVDVIAHRAAAFSDNPNEAIIAESGSLQWRSIVDPITNHAFAAKVPYPPKNRFFQSIIQQAYVESEIIQAIHRIRPIRPAPLPSPKSSLTLASLAFPEALKFVYVLTSELIDVPGIIRISADDLKKTTNISRNKEVYEEEFNIIVENLLDDNEWVYPKLITDKGRKMTRYNIALNKDKVRQLWKRWCDNNKKRKDIEFKPWYKNEFKAKRKGCFNHLRF